MARWERSGASAEEFAVREGVTAVTLRWWRSQLRVEERGGSSTRSSTLVPLAVEVVEARPRVTTPQVEIAVGDAVIRVQPGTDVEYVVALARGLGGPRC